MSSHKNTVAKATLAKGPGKMTVKAGHAKAAMLSGSARKVTNQATVVLRGTTDKVTPNGK